MWITMTLVASRRARVLRPMFTIEQMARLGRDS
jgi:hypothetical protein